MSELVYRQPCAECGSTGYLHEYDHPDSTSLITRSQCHICGGSGRVERVLDPDKVLIHLEWASPRHGFSEKVSVADVLEALRLDDPIEEG